MLDYPSNGLPYAQRRSRPQLFHDPLHPGITLGTQSAHHRAELSKAAMCLSQRIYRAVSKVHLDYKISKYRQPRMGAQS